jgi:hypothetical protein
MMAKAMKSTYTFKLVPGENYRWEIEVFYFNFKSKDLEPLSSSPQTTPRDRKVSFGFLESVKFVDSKLWSVVNSRGNTALLQYDRLSPMLDNEDSKLKRTLIHFKDEGCSKVASTLNKLLVQFHANDQRVVVENDNSVGSCSSLYKGSNPTGSSQSAECSSTSKTMSRGNSSRMSRTQSVSLLTEKFEKNKGLQRLTQSRPENRKEKLDEGDEEIKGAKDDGDETDEADEEDVERGKVEIMQSVEEIIRKAKFLAVKCDEIEIPKDIIINKQKVSHYKESLQKTPDKTQTLVGLVRTVKSVGEEGVIIGKYECWVNCELLLAQMELQIENEGVTERVLTVVHTVYEDDDIDSKVLGSFLSANSKDFSIKFCEKLTYQDLLRFSLRILEEENSDRSKKFVRQTLRGFSKGNRYSSVFIQFASLPSAFLKEFETFTRLYEEGSLNGMKLSTRKLCGLNGKFKRQGPTKLEVPIDILKSNLKVHEKHREDLLKSLLKAGITLPEYKSKLEVSAGLVEVKSNVNKISNQSFSDLKSKYPSQFDDQSLREFIGAKCLPSGPNMHFSKLTEYVNDLLAITPVDDSLNGLNGSVTFVQAENLNMITTGRKVKDADVIFIQTGTDTDRDLFNKFDYAIKEHVLGNTCLCVFAVTESMAKEIRLDFLENGEIVVDEVFVKSDKPATVHGIRKEIVPVVIAGHKNLITDKEISNIYFSNLKQALPNILSSLVKVKGHVLSVFSDESGAIDIDPNGVLFRRGVSICYVCVSDYMEDFVTKVTKKCV